MYCPQLLRIDSPDKRRELIRKLNNLCTGCIRRQNPNANCFPCSKNKQQPGKPCTSCKGHYLLGTCVSCIQLSTELKDRYNKMFANSCDQDDRNITTHLSDNRFLPASMVAYPLPTSQTTPPPKKNQFFST